MFSVSKMRAVRSISVSLGAILISAGSVSADPLTQTANMPDSWLVLYNLNDADSVAWATWYQSQRSIPAANMLGLNASTSEHLASSADVTTQFVTPIQQYLAANPDLGDKVMGFVVGYHLPGHYGTPPAGGPGGKAVANALQDLNNFTQEYNPFLVPHPVPASSPLIPDRLVKADLPPGHYMVARIDAPTLELAKDLTRRAKNIVAAQYFLPYYVVWYDYSDPDLNTLCHCWDFLRQAVEEPRLVDIPWVEFDSDTEASIAEAFRFGTHDVANWDDGRLRGTPAGDRAIAYNFNSWGATTVRSITAEGGRYVPNAIDAGYAAAIGSTGEPASTISPFPDTLLAGLRNGWTLGEAFYVANPQNDWMWIIVGDPFLTIPHWFDANRPGDIDGDGDVDLADFFVFVGCLTGPGVPLQPGCEGADLDNDGDVDVADFALFIQNYTGSQ